jgi:hypothetical protein
MYLPLGNKYMGKNTRFELFSKFRSSATSIEDAQTLGTSLKNQTDGSAN